MAKIYLITLQKDVINPLGPKSDEAGIRDLSPGREKDNEGSKSVKNKEPINTSNPEPDKKKSRSTTIDFEGILDRVVELPVSPGNYWNLVSHEDRIYYFRSSLKEQAKMCYYDLRNLKETEFGERINDFTISADLKKMLVQSSGKFYVTEIPASKINLENAINLDEMKVLVNRNEEWRQIYFECWRQMRDFFYDPNMHGVDWENVKNKYAELLPHVNHRIDLTYIIGEMIAELNCGHAYVGGGDYPKAERIQLGLLGGELVKDKSGFFKIVKIYRSQNWDKSVRCPLTEMGVNAQVGDYIFSVDGISTQNIANIYSLLPGKVNQQVKMRIGKSDNESDSREVTIVPIADESRLIYYDWVQTNIDKVNKATGGRVGYIHIPNMGSEGLNEFAKYFYAQLYKEALIVDDRGNGGGNVSPQIMERLRREPVQVTKARNGAPVFEPSDQIVGPKVALIDEYSASDGDIFAYRFKKSGLGPVIGKRSWGGVVGIRGSLPIVDGGFLNRPEFARYDVDGKDWQIEGHGVDSDIVVDNDPASEFNGLDQQLNKAIDYIMEILKDKQFKEPLPPTYPSR
jgi:tricorn protease